MLTATYRIEYRLIWVQNAVVQFEYQYISYLLPLVYELRTLYIDFI